VENGEEMLSSSRAGLQWKKAVNNQAADEVQAHVIMFLPKDNPAFFDLVAESCKTLVISIDKGWYNSSTGPAKESESLQQPAAEVDFMDADDVVVVE
jgi:hypothetical protein